MLAGAQALPLALPTKHGRPLCILKSEEHFSSISVKAIRELPFLSDEGAENVLVLILDEEDRGVVAFGLLEEGGVTLAVFVQFVEALPVADAGVAWELRDEVVEHGLGEDFALAADVLRSVALASWVLNLLFAVALVRFHCSLGQLAFRAKLLKLRCIINVSTFKLRSKRCSPCIVTNREAIRPIQIDLSLSFRIIDRHVLPTMCKLLHLFRQQIFAILP